MFASDPLAGLNPEQAAAATHPGGHLLVVAGAGSGKTRTLAARVAWLLGNGTAPGRILLLTFTRRAAAEMLARAARTAGHGPAAGVVGGTFHAVGIRLLRLAGPGAGWPARFSVLDGADSAELFGMVRADYLVADSEAASRGTGRRRFPTKETLAAIYSRMVNAQIPLSEVLTKTFPAFAGDADDIREVIAAYAARKAEDRAVDFDDLLLGWRAVLDAAPAWVGAFDHVLVDEFQDTNAVQADILAGLAAAGASITAVGDGAQAIYGFRAGSARHLEEFTDRFPGAATVSLVRNYRSNEPILGVANAVLAGSSARHRVTLWSAIEPDAAQPMLCACADEADQATTICDQVLARRDAGVLLREQAVLFRAAHHSAGLELELARRNIPFVKYGGLKFLDSAHVRDALAVLRVADNPTDELAWWRAVNLVPGVGPATARRILAALGVRSPHPDSAPSGGVDPLQRLLTAGAGWPSAAREVGAQLAETLAFCAADPAPAVPEQVATVRSWLEPLILARYDGAAARLQDLHQLEAMAAGHSDRAGLLADLALDPPASTSDLAGPPLLDDDYLTLSTIHSAKGGEWDAVYVIHAADGNLPSDMAISEPEGLEEERRLLYVAVTRARRHLTVAYPQRFYHRRFGLDDAHSWGQPSRFLTEPAVARSLLRQPTSAGRAGALTPSAGEPGYGDQSDEPAARAVRTLVADLLSR